MIKINTQSFFMTVESHLKLCVHIQWLKARLLSAIKLDQESIRKLLHGALLIISHWQASFHEEWTISFLYNWLIDWSLKKSVSKMHSHLDDGSKLSFFVFGNPEKNSKQHLASSDHKFLAGPQIGKRSRWKSVSKCVCSLSEERRKWRRSRDRFFLMQGCSEQQWGLQDFDSDH